MKKCIIFFLATLLLFSACTSRTPGSQQPKDEEPVKIEMPQNIEIEPSEINEPKPEKVITVQNPAVEKEAEEEPEIEPEMTTGPIPKEEITEVKAVWISYLEFYNLLTEKTEQEFINNVNRAFNNCADFGLNTVIVQVRPFGDSLYNSQYFPWSSICTKVAGKNPGYDPLEIMVKYAHKYNLNIEAWINPYRVKEENVINDAWVLKSESGTLFYDPSLQEVQSYIISGISEIVKNYDVDGIHFDDYFYPEGYIDGRYSGDQCRSFVTSLIRKTYETIKSIDPECIFGVSPNGDLEKCFYKLYADVELWAKNGYVDYIAPQVYYGFYNTNISYAGCVSAWGEILGNASCKMIVGLAMYKSGETDKYAGDGKNEWIENNDTIAAQILYARVLKSYSGFVIFSYDSIFNNSNNVKEEVNNIKKVI